MLEVIGYDVAVWYYSCKIWLIKKYIAVLEYMVEHLECILGRLGG